MTLDFLSHFPANDPKQSCQYLVHILLVIKYCFLENFKAFLRKPLMGLEIDRIKEKSSSLVRLHITAVSIAIIKLNCFHIIA